MCVCVRGGGVNTTVVLYNICMTIFNTPQLFHGIAVFTNKEFFSVITFVFTCSFTAHRQYSSAVRCSNASQGDITDFFANILQKTAAVKAATVQISSTFVTHLNFNFFHYLLSLFPYSCVASSYISYYFQSFFCSMLLLFFFRFAFHLSSFLIWESVILIFLNRGVFEFFCFLYLTLLHLPPLRFRCVGGCWDRTQDCCDFGIGSQTL
jgi:hypothetical protein